MHAVITKTAWHPHPAANLPDLAALGSGRGLYAYEYFRPPILSLGYGARDWGQPENVWLIL